MSAGLRFTPTQAMRKIRCAFVGGVVLLVGAVQPAVAITVNGFAVDDTAVPVEHLVRAAPAKDSISSIDDPQWVATADCDYLENEDILLSVTVGEETRAYPLRILVWHEIVNDTFGDQAVAITYSALTGSGLAFASGENADGTPRKFGVSGVLYNSGLLMYDRATESLWSQLKFMGISKDFVEEPLTPMTTRRMTWEAWKQAFPDGQVLAIETGFDNDYLSEWPYGDYADQKETIFPFDINPDRDEFHTKARMIGMSEGWAARAWPLENIKAKGQMFDSLGATPIQITFDEKTQDVVITDIISGKMLPSVSVYWFAWQAFYPDSSVWRPIN